MRKAILILSLAACSEGGSDGGYTTTAAFDHDNAIAGCQQAARCGFIGASEEKQCETDVIASLKNYPPAYSTTEAVDAKRLAIDPAGAKACVDANKNAGCSVDAYFTYQEKCAGTFKPLVMPGGACKDTLECVGGWCDQGMNGSSGCGGTCVKNTATGATCDANDAHCNDSDFCDDTTMTCTPRAKSGDSCGASPRCQYNLFCQGWIPEDTGQPEVKGICKGPGSVGDDCTVYFFGNTDCSEGLFCDDSLATPKCAKPGVLGAECGSYYGCTDPLDCLGVEFDPNDGSLVTKGKCGVWLDIGKSCSGGGETGCPLDSTCTAGICKLAGLVGDMCDPNSFGGCGDGLFCDGNTSKCGKKVALGAACTPPPIDMTNGFPLGDDPCHDGNCSETSKSCVLECM